MLDIKMIRQQPQAVKAALGRRDEALAAEVDTILALDSEWRSATATSEGLRAAQKRASENVALGKRSGADVGEALQKLKAVSAEVKALSEKASHLQEELLGLLARLPNLPDESAAAGPQDEVLRICGQPAELPFVPRDHLELAGQMIDVDAAARLSGSRFAYLKGALVMLELALVRYALEKLSAHGFTPVIPPVLVRERALYGTGFLPDAEQQIYRLPDDELYLVGTSEVALASLHDGEVIESGALPLRYAGFSPCFRREAGAAGRDTRGIFRVHQFDKVEMFSFVAPESSAQEHERILAIEEEILTELQIPYRVVNIAVADLGASAAKKYDCEAWLPSEGRYRELTSCSNTTDYQARRLEIRMRHNKSTTVLHTLNGTAIAVGRTIIALLENGQQEDGGVELPPVLERYGAPARLQPSPSAL